MSAAEAIRRARLAANLTQDEMAVLSGVRQPNIAAYEGGRRAPSTAMLARLLAAARVRPSAVLRTHRSAVLQIASNNKAGNVRVFGSIARGEDRPDSDIDLLVTFAADASLFDQAALTDELEAELGRPVDVVPEGGLQQRHHEIVRSAVPL